MSTYPSFTQESIALDQCATNVFYSYHVPFFIQFQLNETKIRLAEVMITFGKCQHWEVIYLCAFLFVSSALKTCVMSSSLMELLHHVLYTKHYVHDMCIYMYI